MPALPSDALLFAMDQASYKALLSGASLGHYFDFLADSIAPRQAAVALALSRYEEIAKAREEAAVAPAKSMETPQVTAPVETEKAPEPNPKEEETPIYQVNETAPISYEDVEKAARERKQREREEAKAKKKREEEVKGQREEERRAKEAGRKQRAEELKKKREEERRAKEVERKQQTTERKSVVR